MKRLIKFSVALVALAFGDDCAVSNSDKVKLNE